MALRQRLEQRQKAIFTQSLQQSVKILELPLLELKHTIEAELVNNPAIEEVMDDALPQSSPDSPETPSPLSEMASEEDNIYSSEKELIPKEFINYEKPAPRKKENLSEVLLRQLRINAADEEQIKTGSHIINHIDENGYLRENVPSLAAEIEASEEEILKTLSLIQTFDPPGVGARDLKECLFIQLKKRGDSDALTLKVIQDYIEDLASENIQKLCRRLKCSKEEVTRCIKKIKGLEPKPGRRYSNDETIYIIPDITIEEKDDILNISAKDNVIPLIRVNPTYKNMLKSKKINEETKNFIRERIQNANNLIRAIQNRKETLIKIVSIIAEIQKEAILEGTEKLKPLSLKEIAEKAGVHESTISRVVMNKYVQTPTGVLPLRDFFSTGLKTTDGEDISSQSIKFKIKELIDAEDKTHPLRDQEIANLLRESEKTPIARRTIAKYRKMLRIPAASHRRHSLVEEV